MAGRALRRGDSADGRRALARPSARRTDARRARRREPATWANVRRSWRAYALLAPVFILFIVFLYYPPILGLVRAFYRWAPGHKAAYVGVENFRSYFAYPETPREIANMARFLIAGLIVNVAVPFVTAELVFSVRSAIAKDLYRLLVVIPMLVPGLVVTLLWQKLYDPILGPINLLLESTGLEALARNWLGDPATALYAIIFVGFPWVSGVATLIYLSGLGQISKSVYDSCALDGCGGLRRVVLIDLPLVLGQVRLLTILAVIGALTSFQSVLVLTEGGPGFSTSVPALTMYLRAFRTNQFGYASAIGLLLFIASLGLTVVINRSVRPFQEETE